MNWRALFRSRAAAAAACGLACAGAYLSGGPAGLAGMALGIGGSAFNLLAMWGAIRLMGRLILGDAPGPFVALVAGGAFLIKLPLILWTMSLAQAMGGSAPGAFLAGLAMVYCALIGWALAAS